MIALKVLCAWILADFLSGIIHWIEDKRLEPSRFKFLETVRKDNDLHHERPASILRFTWVENVWASACLTIPLALLLIVIHAPTVLWLAVYFATFGNLTHRFAHLPKIQRNWFLNLVQRSGLLISHEQHLRHHFSPKGRVSKANAKITYCTMTGWLNPILDYVGLWKLLERVFRV